MKTPKHRADPARHGFTLLELMAVVLIMGLVYALVAPGLGTTRNAKLREQARQLATEIEYARQRAVMTGEPHRLYLGVADGYFRVEWWVTEDRALGAVDSEPETDSDFETGGELGEGQNVSLLPPLEDERNYYPVPGRAGRESWLKEGLFIEGVHTPDGWIDQGEVAVVFYRDGSTDAAEIILADEEGRRLSLEVLPLLDVVRIFEPNA